MKADKICKKEGLTVKAMPVPHIYSTECGMCLHFDDSDEQRLKSLMRDAEIPIEVHPL